MLLDPLKKKVEKNNKNIPLAFRLPQEWHFCTLHHTVQKCQSISKPKTNLFEICFRAVKKKKRLKSVSKVTKAKLQNRTQKFLQANFRKGALVLPF